jgi:adenylosuccinate lyase
MHAEPISFGLKMLRFYAEFKRHKHWLALTKKDIEICAISGAVGNFVNISPEVEKYVAEKLKFTPESISSQVIPRDRYARLFSMMAVVAASIENFATEIRHLQRSEVAEVQEPFQTNQKGSSAMPHKRNPIKCENLVGMSRLIRASVTPSLENVTLWHERDMSHSSVERFTATETMILSHYALRTLSAIVAGLDVKRERMQRNIDNAQGVFFSQRLMLNLIKKGMSRDTAYKLIQTATHKALDEGKNFVDIAKETKEFTEKLNETELKDIFDINYYMTNVDVLFKRVLG